MTDVELVPVIHTRPAELGVIDFEAKRVNEVQHATGDGAHATDITRVRRDLRTEQNEMQGRLHRRRLIAREISRLDSRSLMS